LVKVEIKQEPEGEEREDGDEDNNCFAFDFFRSFDMNDDCENSSSKDEHSSVKVKRRKQPKASGSNEHKLTRMYNKLTPDERKQRGNRGMRRAKEAIKITTGEKLF
jgi:hypothetical protein